MARPLAERGYQVLIQSTRGGFGSGGTDAPLRREREDGLATLDWVVRQPWFGEAIVLVGVSYMGYVQWAVVDRLPCGIPPATGRPKRTLAWCSRFPLDVARGRWSYQRQPWTTAR